MNSETRKRGRTARPQAGAESGTVFDPVCGMEVSADTGICERYDGNTYLFCSAHCQGKFRNSPDRYAGSTLTSLPKWLMEGRPPPSRI